MFLGEHLVGLLYQQLPCGFALFSLLSPSQGLLSVFCLQSFGEEPLASLSVQGSSALTSPLLWLKRCESEEEDCIALSKSVSGPDLLRAKYVDSTQLNKLYVWCQVSCPGPIWHLPCRYELSIIPPTLCFMHHLPHGRIKLGSRGAWRR